MATTYEHILKSGHKVQVDSAIRDGNGKKIDTNYALKNELSNPNLLINGDFQINQRGISSYSHSGGGWKYTVDRWRIGVGGSFNTSSQVVTLDNTGSFDQALPVDEIGYLKGREVTFSIYINGLTGSGVFTIYDGVSTSTETLQNGLNVLTKTLSASMTILRCLVNNNSGSSMSFIPVYAKLEIGSVATPFSPRPYAEELNMCKRYFFESYGGRYAGNQYSTTAYIFIPTCVQMRTAPTITVSAYGSCYTATTSSGNNGGTTTPTAVSNVYLKGNGIEIDLTVSNTGNGNRPTIWTDGIFTADAELY